MANVSIRHHNKFILCWRGFNLANFLQMSIQIRSWSFAAKYCQAYTFYAKVDAHLSRFRDTLMPENSGTIRKVVLIFNAVHCIMLCIGQIRDSDPKRLQI